MALTQISTAGVKDDAVTSGKIPANAVGSSEIADTAVTLAKLEHGTSSNNGKFLRANNGADPTFESVNTDLVSDTSPQLGGDLDTNSFEILLDDDHKVKFGASGTMNIRHTGSYGILENATGALYLRSSSFVEMRGNNNETFLKGTENGSVELYYDATKRFETVSDGARWTGHLYADDNYKLRLGNSEDLQIYHDGSNSKIQNTQTGRLHIENSAGLIRTNTDSGFYIQSADGNTTHAEIDSDGLKFNGDTAAANALDDYEEGTFTPTNTIGLTLTNNTTAHYTKIGRVCHIQIDCTFSGSADTAICGIIQGLPFTSKSGCVNEGSLQFISNTANAKFNYDEDNTRIFIGASESRIDIQNITTGNFQTRAFMVGRRFRIQMHYLTA